MVFRASVLENGEDILSVPAACMAEGYFVYRIETATGVAIRANNTLVETRAAPTPTPSDGARSFARDAAPAAPSGEA